MKHEETLAEAAIRIIMARYFTTMSEQEKSELKNDFEQAFREVLEATQESVGQEPGMSY